ncbi:MAG: glycerophosphodiester phosphodiesterase [Micromonosporaceae bacterium]
MAYRIAALVLVGLLVTAAMSVAVVTASRGEAGVPAPVLAAGREVATIAHRGASAYAPENTLPAIELAVEQHADLVEIDVQQTRDGVLVVIHDTTLARTTDVAELHPLRGPWRVADFTYAELRELDAGAWFGEESTGVGEFTGVRVPTLREVLETLEETDAGLLLEVKAPALYPGIAQRVADGLDGRAHWGDGGRRLIVQSFDWGFVREFAELRPKVEVGVLGTPTAGELAEVARYADQVNPQYGSFDAAYLRQVHELGMASLVWTIDDPEQIRATVEAGADGVITNQPDAMRRLLYAAG